MCFKIDYCLKMDGLIIGLSVVLYFEGDPVVKVFANNTPNS